MKRPDVGKIRKVHPHAWLWEPMEHDPGFVLNSMFGAKTAYLDGKIYLGFTTRGEPWHGVLVTTDRERQAALTAEFPSLRPHPILPKWLYLPEAVDDFERVATRLVQLALRRDPRFGVVPQPKRRRRKRPSKPAGGPGRPT